MLPHKEFAICFFFLIDFTKYWLKFLRFIYSYVIFYVYLHVLIFSVYFANLSFCQGDDNRHYLKDEKY